MLPITNRERETIVFHKKNKIKNADISKWLRISVSTITRIWHMHQITGSYDAKPQNGGRKSCVSQSQMNLIIAKIHKNPDITLNKLIDKYNLKISESALCRRLLKLDYTLKKRQSIQ